MAFSIVIKALERRDKIAYVRIGKNEIEIPATNLAELRAWINDQFSDSEELLMAMALRVLLARDPNLQNVGALVGKTITFDPAGRINYPDSVFRVS